MTLKSGPASTKAPPAFLEVAISTLDRNGAVVLAQRLAAEATSLDDVSIAVFNNGTSHNIAADIRKLDGVRFSHDNVAGLARARNRALSSSDAVYILFLDDDVLPPVGFLAAVVKTLKSNAPDILGAPIDPAFDAAPPQSLPIEYVTRRKAQVSGWSPRGAVSGGNFAVRRETAIAIGGFREDLGMTGARMGFLEELEFVLRYRASPVREGPGIYYDLGCALQHPMPAAATRISYLAKRAWRSHFEKGQLYSGLAGEDRRGAYRLATISALLAAIGGRIASAPREIAGDGATAFIARTRLALTGAAGLVAGAFQPHRTAAFAPPAAVLEEGRDFTTTLPPETDPWGYGAIWFRRAPGLRYLLSLTLEAPIAAIEVEEASAATRILAALGFVRLAGVGSASPSPNAG